MILYDKNGNSYSISSARRYAAVTPNDSDTIDEFKALYIGGDGNIKVGNENDDAVTFNNVVAGSILTIYGNQVYSTGTTASNIVALRD